MIENIRVQCPKCGKWRDAKVCATVRLLYGMLLVDFDQQHIRHQCGADGSP